MSAVRAWIQLTRLDRPIGILLLLWPTLWALWIAAEGQPKWGILIVFCLGVVLMRSAGCAINDFADRKLDGQVQRTRGRPLVNGDLRPRTAVLTFLVLCLLAFGLVLLLNKLTMKLSFVAVALAAVYPFCKRYTHLPQLVLGAAFAMAVPMAFAAQTGEIPKVAWLLFICTLVWTVAYDSLYAMVDREDDLKAGIKSTAILFGDLDLLIIGMLQLTVLLGLLLAGLQLGLSGWYYLGLILASACAVWQLYICRHREPQQCFRAFLNNNWLGACVFAGLFLEYMMR